MALNIGDNFSYLGKKFLDARQSFNTLEEMNSCNDVPEGFITYCKENNKRYEYKNNTWIERVSDSITQTEIDKWNSAGMTDEEKEQLETKFDNATSETIIDENENKLTKITFYSNGNEMKSVQFKNGDDGINMDDVVYYGDDEPTNDNVIWFVPNNSLQTNISYDNPIIVELINTIRNMQSQITQLQADVEYLKIHGGGSGSGSGNEPIKPPITSTYSYLVLEDGSKLLLEDGSGILLEQQNIINNSSYLVLEDGSKLLLEDGSGILLEQQQSNVTNSSCLLLETGDRMLLENGDKILLEA